MGGSRRWLGRRRPAELSCSQIFLNTDQNVPTKVFPNGAPPGCFIKLRYKRKKTMEDAGKAASCRSFQLNASARFFQRQSARSKLAMRSLQTLHLIYSIKVSVSRIAGNTRSFDYQFNNENRISNCLPESMESWAVETHRRGSTGARVGHACACTFLNPHSGRAQTAVFQNTEEGNYKLGRSLDGHTGGVLGRILSRRLRRGPTGAYTERTMTHTTSL